MRPQMLEDPVGSRKASVPYAHDHESTTRAPLPLGHTPFPCARARVPLPNRSPPPGVASPVGNDASGVSDHFLCCADR